MVLAASVMTSFGMLTFKAAQVEVLSMKIKEGRRLREEREELVTPLIRLLYRRVSNCTANKTTGRDQTCAVAVTLPVELMNTVPLVKLMNTVPLDGI
jgi:hypothetical protein